MRAVWIGSLLLMTALMAGGCSYLGFGDEDDEETPDAAAEQPSQAAEVPVEGVRGIEVGRTRRGMMITAYGTAPGIGFGAPRLVPRRGGRPGPEGFLDFDFVATPPDPGFELPAGPVKGRALRADLELAPEALQGAAGIRVHARVGGMMMPF